MILKALKYKSQNWSIVSGSENKEVVAFENINLFVGRNASGKTRLIESLRWISDLLDAESNIEDVAVISTYFEVVFKDKQNIITYTLNFDEQASITDENLSINSDVKLQRREKILFYEGLGQNLPFEINERFLAISRRDNVQQPFFEILHNWGKNLAHYSFGGNMGKGQYKMSDWENTDKINLKNFNKVNVIFNKGTGQVGGEFIRNIINDMKYIDYNLDIILLDTASKYLFLKVKESDLDTFTYFEQMSQGMARAFSLIVQLNYSLMAKIPSCILIDDIGEGLDYDRSKKLIELIIEKAEGSNIQVFMTTNDRFVMNSVPLKYWSVIHREGNKSVFYNYQNSKQTFDDFALTGFNNFDFFATEFYRLGFEEFIQTA
jgi:AAA15 family ATPase/GTPase